MGFSVVVEMLNLRLRRTTEQPVAFHEPYKGAVAAGVASSVASSTPTPEKTNNRKKNQKKRK
jgi:hypothetical protein